MRLTLNIDEALLARALELSGLSEKYAVLHEGLKALIARESANRLALLGGSEPNLQATVRRNRLYK